MSILHTDCDAHTVTEFLMFKGCQSTDRTSKDIVWYLLELLIQSDPDVYDTCRGQKGP
ncbi:hypothetical protein M422DRAFT_29084 [Sphaerobolus stellatus SS14]|uniref:Uncharacterized protein n=1 Tax=Sphaerobolus stellatus (strain SS14) TaxID=990650 RepID=A0A0C9UV06_SPHS4|nr:hypothetical protein M422DRAFT_39513 [Sphaerobolus stellatus SS14]KIJ46895.1 hypothetical protein M422DRAFT_29084 [Sphaerobolus stellatus SS14]